MTAPITFPTIQPAQVVPRQDSGEDSLLRFFLDLQNQREQRDARRAQLDMQRQALVSNLETDKLTRDQKKRELEIADLREQAASIADDYALQFMSLGSKADNTAAIGIAQKMYEQNPDKKLKPYLAAAFAERVKNQQEMLGKIATRTTEESGARVATATEGAKVETGNLQPTLTRAQLAVVNQQLTNAQLEEKLKQDEINLDPARRQQITQMLEGGATLGEAYKNVGRDLPAGADPNWRMDLKGTGGALAARNRGLAAQAEMGLSQISVPLSGKADFFRMVQSSEGLVGVVGRRVINPRLSPAERQTIQGYGLLTQAYRTYVTGQQSSNTERLALENTIVAWATDDPATQMRKKAVANLLPRVIAAGMSPTEIMDALIAENLRLGAPKKVIDVLTGQRAIAAKYELTPEYKQGTRGGAAVQPDALDPGIGANFRTIP